MLAACNFTEIALTLKFYLLEKAHVFGKMGCRLGACKGK